MSEKPEEIAERILFACDAEGKWYSRRVRAVEHDLTNDEKIYYCDRHRGGPFATISDIPEVATVIKEAEARAYERAAETAEAEQLTGGDMPDELHLVRPEDLAAGTVRATANSIARAIRAANREKGK